VLRNVDLHWPTGFENQSRKRRNWCAKLAHRSAFHILPTFLHLFPHWSFCILPSTFPHFTDTPPALHSDSMRVSGVEHAVLLLRFMAYFCNFAHCSASVLQSHSALAPLVFLLRPDYHLSDFSARSDHFSARLMLPLPLTCSSWKFFGASVVFSLNRWQYHNCS